MKNITLKIKGIHCEGCAMVIQSLIERTEGIRTISVSFEKREARILFEPVKIEKSQLIQIIKKAGYKVIEEVKTYGIN